MHRSRLCFYPILSRRIGLAVYRTPNLAGSQITSISLSAAFSTQPPTRRANHPRWYVRPYRSSSPFSPNSLERPSAQPEGTNYNFLFFREQIRPTSCARSRSSSASRPSTSERATQTRRAGSGRPTSTATPRPASLGTRRCWPTCRSPKTSPWPRRGPSSSARWSSQSGRRPLGRTSWPPWLRAHRGALEEMEWLSFGVGAGWGDYDDEGMERRSNNRCGLQLKVFDPDEG